jgi:hypothetical protein
LGAISLTTLPDFDETFRLVTECEGLEKDWIYAPLCKQYVLGQEVRTLPYKSRVFGLPKIHVLTHATAAGEAHLDFLVWALSFIFGLRLSATEAGFLDATPTKIGTLTDFVLSPVERLRALVLAERFWQANAALPLRAKRWAAAVHALFLGKGPHLLDFERFIYLYGAVDACFALAQDLLVPNSSRYDRHAGRIAWLCRQVEVPVPDWADDSSGTAPVAVIRNHTLHESLFLDAPLGFSTIDTHRNLLLEMEAVICRLLVALLGDSDNDYVRSPVNTRQRVCWIPPLSL